MANLSVRAVTTEINNRDTQLHMFLHLHNPIHRVFPKLVMSWDIEFIEALEINCTLVECQRNKTVFKLKHLSF